MYRNLTISVCLPCRNEGGHLLEVVKTIPSIADEIIVISNASTDDSVAVARRAGAIAYEDNRTLNGIGYGYAHMTGMAAATGDIVVGLDADGTYPVEQLEELVDYMLDHDVDFLSCSRLQRSVMPLKLQVGIRLLNLEIGLLYGRRFNDTLSGMWVFRRDILPRLRLDRGDWNLSPQIKIEAATAVGVRFAEYPVMQKARLGTTHQRYFRTGLSHAWWIFRNCLAQPRSAILDTAVYDDAASEE
jgi:glycosyltransferase involved in cell wall biosynthesis